MPLGHVEVVNAIGLLNGLWALARIVHSLFEFVSRHSCIPLDEIDDPGEKNGCAFIYLCQMVWSQMPMKVVEDLDNSLDQTLLNL